MHGVKRADRIELEKVNDGEARKIESYKALIQQFQDLYLQKDHTEEWRDRMLSCSQELATINPEYYTVWNERKRALKLSPQTGKDSIKKELMISVLAIRANPKSYGAWHHRRWFIENYCGNAKEAVVEEELKLLSQLLELDCRNFHGWNYRIWLSDWAGTSIIDEFDFTTLKIYQNFSNYSAWQRRSHLLPKYLSAAFPNSTTEIESFLRNEVEMCRNAAWTEPADQSIWFYQRWLFGNLPNLLGNEELKKLLTEKLARDQIKSVIELIEEEGRGFNVALAMSFVRFMCEHVTFGSDSGGVDYLHDLKSIDQLRKGHWSSFGI